MDIRISNTAIHNELRKSYPDFEFFFSPPDHARGTCAIIRKSSFKSIELIHIDNVDDTTVVKLCTMHDTTFNFAITYGPNRDAPEFFRTLFDGLTLQGCPYVVAGDLNVILSMELDSNEHRARVHGHVGSKNVILDEIGAGLIVDAFRTAHPHKRVHSWKLWNDASKKWSRLDLSLIHI